MNTLLETVNTDLMEEKVSIKVELLRPKCFKIQQKKTLTSI